ncbi:MAG: glycosyltransferase [Planctomycetes bacterium]|nr:glycosyltransferase [Planctomycetota bacterium]
MNTARHRLAVCIPSYNREAYIEATLASVLVGADERTQICLSDNASIDQTVARARSALAGRPHSPIHVAPRNLGADANYLSAVALADADHCMILGSDDLLAPQALARIHDVLAKEDPDILMFDRRTCTIDMRPVAVEHLLRVPAEAAFDFRTASELDRYLGRARSLCAAFSYISGIVFRKSLWDAATGHEAWLGSAYVHSYKLMSACIDGLRLHYLPEALVDCRLGNDSFRDQGLCHRVLIDLDGFARLAHLLDGAGRPGAATALRGLIRAEYPFWRLVRYQSILSRDPQWPGILARLGTDFAMPAARLGLARTLGTIPGVGRASFVLRDLGQR